MSAGSCAWLAVAAFLIALSLTVLLRRAALKAGMLDQPNARSSHAVPVPRGGGLSIVAVGLGAAVLPGCGLPPVQLAAWLGGGALVAIVGFLDDRRGMGAAPRAAAHALAGLAVALACSGLPNLPVAGRVIDLGAAGVLIALLAVVWSVNLFNFMDGIDGIAGAQALYVFGAGAALCGYVGATQALAPMVALAAASAGFLCLNWSPARIFMGDAGSGYVGFAIAATALYCAGAGGPSAWVWLILDGAFVVDATVTLGVRWRRGEHLATAHRSHAYQRLARRLRSHPRVTLLYALINVLWLLPLAGYATIRPGAGPVASIVALAPLVLLAIYAGAGRPGEMTPAR